MLRFSSIHQRLAETVELASHADNRTVLQHIRHAKQEFDGITHALETLTGAHDDLLQKIATLQGLNSELKQISQGIVELARQGHQHSDTPGPEPLRQQIDQIGLALQATLAAARQLHNEEAGQVEHTRSVIRRVLADFRQSAGGMSQAIGTLENVNRGVEEEIHDIMVQLQFQDRVGQILEHVRQDIDKLQQQLQQQAPLPDLASWQDQLFATYTTQEQRQLHPRAPADPGSKSVEFF